MELRRWQLALVRLFFLSYVLFTASYCLLAYIPFTYQQVHVGELLPWLTRLVRLHSLLFWPALAAAWITIWRDLKSGPARYLARGFAGAGLVAGIALLIHPLLPQLRNDSSSLRWSMIALVPLVWLAAIDWLRGYKFVAWQGMTEDASSTIFLASAQAAIYLTAVYFLVAVFRIWSAHNFSFSLSLWTSVVLWSLLSHLLVFFLLFVLFDFVSLLASLFSNPRLKSKTDFFGTTSVIAALIALTVRYIVLPPLSLDGAVATVVAIALAVSLVLFAVGAGFRLRDPGNHSTESQLDLLLVPFRFLRDVNWASRSVALLALAILAGFVEARASRLDWEFLLQKITVLFVWTLAFAIFYTTAPKVRRVSRVVAYTAGAAILAAYLGLGAAQPRTHAESGSATFIGKGFNEFQGYDISFRLVDEMLRPQLSSPSDPSTASFYSFLAANTNIPRSIHLTPVDIHLVSKLSAAAGRRPNIFVIVVDSLRRDYLSPYNPAVRFTPAIDQFARESVVFRNAFTRYGGTGLSEPSIWVGGLIAHQQYTSPFAPMNSLQKLLDINHYREWISKDNVLQQVVPSAPNIDELDKNIGAMSYDLCRTLREVAEKLPSAGKSDDPIFVYTQAQNIHVSVIDREGRSVPDGLSFPPAFDAAYASRVQRIDGCLSAFLEELKKNRIYDDSVIVLTSDHGDSLGERGRWGHAYTIFPEIVRVPMIVHLPADLREKLKYDSQAVSFLTDLTPSLYYLLGERPLMNNPLFGRPLFTETMDEQSPYLRNSYLLVSSYAPVYGLLSRDGRRLYIADGVNYRDYAYDLDSAGGSQEVPLSESERSEAQNGIREQVRAVARFYGLQQ